MSSQSIDNLFHQSLLLQQAGKILEARANIKKILKKIPAHIEALHLIGLTYIQTREFEKAIAAIKRVVTIKPTYAEAYFNLGNAYSEMQRFEEAIEAFEKTLLINPDHWKASCNLGNMHYMQKRMDEAITCFKRAITINPDFAEAYIGLGVVYGDLKRFGEAVSLYSQAIALNPQVSDAHNNLGFSYLELERYQEAIASFKKAVALNPAYVDAYIGLARSFIALKQPHEAVSSYKNAFSIRPDPECAYELANLLMLNELKQFEDAVTYYKHFLSANPHFSDAQISLGIALDYLLRFDEAVTTFEKILEIEPDNCPALNNLGNALVKLKRPEEAIARYQQALNILPQFHEAHNGLGNALKEFGRIDEAIDKYEQALAINPEFTQASWNRALMYLLQGNFQQGWLDYEQRWKLEETVALPHTPYPRWLGEEDISGKKLLLQAEQGFGDVIQMVRYVDLLIEQGAECWIQCAQPVVKLFSRSFPDAHVIDTSDYPIPCDYHLPMMSLPSAMKTFTESAIPNKVPYLKADPERLSYWKSEFKSSSLKVGLVWRGDPNHGNDHNRSAKLPAYLPLIAENPAIHFVTLQKDLTAKELELLSDHANVSILDAELIDFDESAAVISALDLVITIDSAPAHLAGALAIPTWVLLPFIAEWRWHMDRSDSPWYPTTRLFRQEAIDDWPSVMNEVNVELKILGEAAHV